MQRKGMFAVRDLRQKQLSSRVVNEVGIFRVIEDQATMPDGREIRRVFVRKPSAVVIVPITDEGKVVLVRQWRYPVDRAMIELPAGGLEAGEDPQEAVMRELQEEAGYKPGRLTKLNESFPVPGYCDEMFHFYLAEQLQESKLPGDEDEDIDVLEMSFEEALSDPLICLDLKTVAGIYMAREHLRQRG